MGTRRKSTGSHIVKKQLVYKTYHPQRSCSKCILCGKSAIHSTHFGALGGDENDFIAQHVGSTPSPDSCMCKAHSAEAKCNHLQEGCTPKWKQLSTATGSNIHSCIHPQCSATSATVKRVSPAFEEIDNLEAALCAESTPDHPFLVCPKHYQDLYRQFRTHNHVQAVESSQNRGLTLQDIALMLAL